MPYKNLRWPLEVEIWGGSHFLDKGTLVGRNSNIGSGYRMEMWDPDNPKIVNAIVSMEITCWHQGNLVTFYS